jgi:hypothetical protein
MNLRERTDVEKRNHQPGRSWARLLVPLFLLGWSCPASARLNPVTEPFDLNAETAGDQTFPRIFAIEDGGFIAVWHHALFDAWRDCSTPCDQFIGCATTGCEVYAQLFRLTATPECPGDCNGDGTVLIDEIITAVDLALHGTAEQQAEPTRWPALESRGDCRIIVDEIVRAVRGSLEACPPL